MTAPDSSPGRAAHWRWWIAGLLLLATAISYMDRMTLISASVRVKHEFGLLEKQYGDFETAFGLAFGVGSVLFGYLVDRFRVFWIYPLVLTAWSLVGAATGLTQGYGSLLVLRALLGFFEGGHWPCALRTISTLFTEKDRTMGNSILQSGASIGAVVTPQIMKLLMNDQPGAWRSAFVIVGFTGLLWVMLWFVSLRRRDLEVTVGISRETEGPGWTGILSDRRLYAVALLVFGIHIVWHIYRVWLMSFLQTGRGYTERAALNFNSLFFLATDAGCLLAGFAARALINRGTEAHDARFRVFVGACLLTSLSVFIPKLEAGWLLLSVLLVVGAGALALFPCYYSFLQELSERHLGRITGLLSLWVWSIGSPVHSFFGYIADRTHSYDTGLALAGLAPWLGVAAMLLLWRKPA